MGWRTRPLAEASQIDRSSFTCGFEPIDTFFKEDIVAGEQEDLFRVFVLINDDCPSEAAGFYTLGNSSISYRDIPERYRLSKPYEIPAILIGQLALHMKYHGKQLKGMKLSKVLLVDAYERIVRLWQQSPSAFNAVRVDTREQRAFEFWKKQGFIPYHKHEHGHKQGKTQCSLFLPVKTIEILMSEEFD